MKKVVLGIVAFALFFTGALGDSFRAIQQAHAEEVVANDFEYIFDQASVIRNGKYIVNSLIYFNTVRCAEKDEDKKK